MATTRKAGAGAIKPTRTPKSAKTSKTPIKSSVAKSKVVSSEKALVPAKAQRTLPAAPTETPDLSRVVEAEQNIAPIATPVTKDDVIRLQAPLIERLNVQMVHDNLNQGQFAEKLGITASYVTSIFNGFRWVPKSERSVIEAIANYMGVPVVQIFIWSGFFSPTDMVASDNLSGRVNALHEQMMADPMVRHIAPQKSEWLDWDLETRLRFVMLYEVASRTALLDHAQMELADSTLKRVRWVLADDRKK